MKKQLYRLFVVDRKAWLRMQFTAFSVALAIGSILALTGSSLVSSSFGASITAILTISMWTAAYCRSSASTREYQPENEQFGPVSRRQLALAGSMFATAVLLGISSPRLQSAVVYARWKRLQTKQPLQGNPAEWLKDGAAVLDLAKSTKTKVSKQSLTRFSSVASSLVDKPTMGQSAYQALLASAQYRSSVYEDDFLGPTNEFIVYTKYGKPWQIDIAGYNPHGPTPVSIHFKNDTVSADIAARLEELGTNPNRDHPIGPEEIIFSANGTTLKLDGFWMKKVTVKDAVVFYRGSAVRLENVAFSNCSFNVKTAAGLSLLKQVSQYNRVTLLVP